MPQENNAGYTLTDRLSVGDYEFVIGQREVGPSRYVTWKCRKGETEKSGTSRSVRRGHNCHYGDGGADALLGCVSPCSALRFSGTIITICSFD